MKRKNIEKALEIDKEIKRLEKVIDKLVHHSIELEDQNTKIKSIEIGMFNGKHDTLHVPDTEIDIRFPVLNLVNTILATYQLRIIELGNKLEKL